MTTIEKMSLRELYEKLELPWDANLDKLLKKYTFEKKDEDYKESSYSSRSNERMARVSRLKKEINMPNTKSYETDDENK